MDEAVPVVSGSLAYVVVATVLVEEDERVITDALNGIFLDQLRRNPFHWQHEGIQAREKMLACLADLGAVAHVIVHHPTGRRKQERAREAAFRLVLPKLVNDGVNDLLIESRSSHQDGKDRQSMVEFNRALGSQSIKYGWESKRRPDPLRSDAQPRTLRFPIAGAGRIARPTSS